MLELTPIDRRKTMNIEEYLRDRDIDCTRMPHSDTYDAQRMAHSVHVPGREVAKTVLLRADHGYKYIVAVLPANRQVNLELVSKALGGSQIDLATEIDIAQHCPDCEIGALPPFGSQYNMTTLIDGALLQDEEIVFEGNTHHESIRMKLEDFRRLEEPLVGHISYVNAPA